MNVSKKLLFSNNEKKILQLVPDYSVPRYTSYPTAPNLYSKTVSVSFWLKVLIENGAYYSNQGPRFWFY